MNISSSATAVGMQIADLVASYDGVETVHGISFSVEPSEFVTLLGPSGCGKSTTMRCIAGLHHLESGRITIGQDVIAAPGIHVRPERRHVNMVFQSYAVWPHMSVFENVAYGLQLMKLSRAEISSRAHDMLALVGLAELGDRPATGLSGGQQQRVALARALATRPRILLLDEPLSNLDSLLRARMRAEILRVQREVGTTTLYVTHDRGEALSMSDKIVIMNKGKIVQIGKPQELYTNPANRFVAGFLGPANFIRGEVRSVDSSRINVVAPDLMGSPCFAMKPGGGADVSQGQMIDLIVRPECLTVSDVGAGADFNTFDAEFMHRDFLGSRTEITIRSGKTILSCEVEGRQLQRIQGPKITLSVAPEDFTWVRHED